MNADDRRLIEGLFERMRNVGSLDKDRDAETFIHESMRKNPNSPYLLVQSVLAQEQALQRADERIRELEDDVDRLEEGGSGQPAAWEAGPRKAAGSVAGKSSMVGPRSSAGFGGGNTAGSTASPAAAGGRSPWQGKDNEMPRQGERQFAGSSFMAQAMTTAAGVAGGMLLANGISSLFSGGSSGTPSVTPLPGPTEAAATDLADGTGKPQGADATQPADGQNEPGAVEDASYNDDGMDDWGGGDWSDAFDI